MSADARCLPADSGLGLDPSLSPSVLSFDLGMAGLEKEQELCPTDPAVRLSLSSLQTGDCGHWDDPFRSLRSQGRKTVLEITKLIGHMQVRETRSFIRVILYWW